MTPNSVMTAAQKFIELVKQQPDEWFHPKEYDETIWSDLQIQVDRGALYQKRVEVVAGAPQLGALAFFKIVNV